MLRSKEKPQQNDSISYYLKKILQVLDSRSDVTEVDITRIELPYIQALNHHGHPTHPNRVLALHRVLSKDTEVFITFLSWMYRRKDGQADTVLSNLPQEEKEARASFAYLILSEWEFLPGQQNDGGEIDEVAFKNWHESMLQLADEADR